MDQASTEEVLRSLWFKPLRPAGNRGPMGGRDLFEALAPVLFSARSEENVAPSWDPQPSLWVWAAREEASSFLAAGAGRGQRPQETEGVGLQEAATCSPPPAFRPRTRLGTFDHPLPHPQRL